MVASACVCVCVCWEKRDLWEEERGEDNYKFQAQWTKRMMVMLPAIGKSSGEKKLPLPPLPTLTSSLPSPHPPISAPLDLSPLLFASLKVSSGSLCLEHCSSCPLCLTPSSALPWSALECPFLGQPFSGSPVKSQCPWHTLPQPSASPFTTKLNSSRAGTMLGLAKSTSQSDRPIRQSRLLVANQQRGMNYQKETPET